MSKQANKTLIGGFVVGAVGLIVAGVLVFGSGRLLSERRSFVLYFEGSVKGLDVGAPVVFRGVKVGSVTDIRIRAFTEDLTVQIPVFIEVDPARVERVERNGGSIRVTMKRLLDRGLRAQLQMKSVVTGQMMIELDFYPHKPLKLVGDGTIPEIPTIPSSIEELTKAIDKVPIEEIFEKMLASVEGIEKILNSPKIPKMADSLNRVLEEAQKFVLTLNAEVAPLVSSINGTLHEYEKLARHVDVQVQPLVRDTRKLVRNVDARIGPLAAGMEETLQKAAGAMVQARKTLSTFEEDSEVAYELTSMLKELGAAAHSIRIMADYFEQHPEALVKGKGTPMGGE